MRRPLLLAATALAFVSTPALAQSVSVPPAITVTEGSPWSVPVSRIGPKNATLSFAFRTIDGSAIAGQDYIARSGSQSIRKNASKYTLSGATTDDQVHEGEETFVLEVTPKGQATVKTTITIKDNDAAPPPATQTCPDGSVIPADQICPTPPPTEPPPPTTGGWVAPPTADGEVPINQSEGDLVATSIPGTAAPDVVGAFRFVCRVGEVNQNDSLVYFNQPGKAHWHFNYGLTQNKADDTYAAMQTKAAYSTCQLPTIDPGNRSEYWTAATLLTLPAGATAPVTTKLDTSDPTAVDANGKLTRPKQFFWLVDHFTLYYKRRPNTDPACTYTSVWGPQVAGCVPLPNGINMIFGFDMKNLVNGPRQAEFSCVGQSGVDSTSSNIMGPALAKCAAAWEAGLRTELRMVVRLEAPSCWDPRWLDSPNHQDHLSYQAYKPGDGRNGCMQPASGAIVLKSIPGLTYLASHRFTQEVYDAYKADPAWGVHLSSDEHVRMTKPDFPAGASYHADFRMSWLVKVRNKWEGNCINKLLNCSAGNLGNGQMLRGGGAPYYPSLGRTSWEHPTNIVPVRSEGYGADW